MMNRWTFFFEEGNVTSDCKTEEESERIAAWVKANDGSLLEIPALDTVIFVNLRLVKCIAKQLVDENTPMNGLQRPEAVEEALKASSQVKALEPDLFDQLPKSA